MKEANDQLERQFNLMKAKRNMTIDELIKEREKKLRQSITMKRELLGSTKVEQNGVLGAQYDLDM